MSTTVAVIAANVATTNAVIASNAEQTAKEERCKIVIDKFVTPGTIAEKQQYAECVQTLYPVSEAPPMSLKIGISLVLLCVLIGMISGFIRCRSERIEGALMGAFGGFSFAVIIGLIAIGILIVLS